MKKIFTYIAPLVFLLVMSTVGNAPISSAHTVGPTITFTGTALSSSSVELSWTSTSTSSPSLGQHDLYIWRCLGAGCVPDTSSFSTAIFQQVSDFLPLYPSGSYVDSGLVQNSTYRYTIRERHGGAVTSGTSATTGDIVLPPPDENTLELCSNGIDDDEDALVDLDDPDCASFVPKLTVNKVVVNDNGGLATVADFQAKIDGVDVSWGVATTVSVGAHTVSEVQNVSGYSASAWGGDCAADGSITLAIGDNKTCTITNDDIAPKLTVIKTIINNNGGTKIISSFTYLVGAQEVLSSVQNMFNAGSHTVSEQGNAGYNFTFGDACSAEGEVSLALGDEKICTIENDDIEPSLTLVKVVVDDDDDNDSTPASAWTLTATGPTGFSGAGPAVSNDPSFSAGTYDLSESGPAGYSASDWVCEGGTQVDGDTISVGLGESVTCTITNDDIPLPICSNGADDDGDGLIDSADPGCHSDLDPENEASYTPEGETEGDESTLALCTDGLDNDADELIDLEDPHCSAFIPKLTVNKVVINDNFGTLNAEDFSFTVNGGDPIAFEADGSNNVFVDPGEYDVAEVATAGYTSLLGENCSGTIAAGETKICTITNDDKVTKLIINKILINDSGKTALMTAFSFFLDGEEDSVIFEEDGQNDLIVEPGTYTVTENDAPGYDTTYDMCTEVTLLLGDVKTCTITNDDIPACSDGLDNDADGLVDADDPGCHTNQDPEDPESYDPDLQTEGDESTLALCTDGLDNDGDEQVDLEDADCSAFKPKLTVTKVVTNDNGGTKSVEDFPLFIDQEPTTSGVQVMLDEEGTYTVSESGDANYTATFSEDCDSSGSVTLVAGDIKSCTITNNDNPPPVVTPPPPPPPSGGGGGGSVVPIILVITNEQALTSQGAVTITWDTNIDATSQVIYGPMPGPYFVDLNAPNLGYPFGTEEDQNKVRFHSMTLPDLIPGQTYIYRVVSRASPPTLSPEHQFTVSPGVVPPPPTPPPASPTSTPSTPGGSTSPAIASTTGASSAPAGGAVSDTTPDDDEALPTEDDVTPPGPELAAAVIATDFNLSDFVTICSLIALLILIGIYLLLKLLSKKSEMGEKSIRTQIDQNFLEFFTGSTALAILISWLLGETCVMPVFLTVFAACLILYLFRKFGKKKA